MAHYPNVIGKSIFLSNLATVGVYYLAEGRYEKYKSIHMCMHVSDIPFALHQDLFSRSLSPPPPPPPPPPPAAAGPAVAY